jgi:small ubiquitin-related modifier
MYKPFYTTLLYSAFSSSSDILYRPVALPFHFIFRMSADDNGSPPTNKPEEPQQAEHLNIKVTDNNNEVFFKIKRTTQLKKLMDAFCERQGKAPTSVRFLFDGSRVQPTDSPDTVSAPLFLSFFSFFSLHLAANGDHPGPCDPPRYPYPALIALTN